jgi:carboxylesterase type B
LRNPLTQPIRTTAQHLKRANDQYTRVKSFLECSNAACLRQKSPARLLAAQQAVFNETYATVDGETLLQHPYKLLSGMARLSVRVLIGKTRDEGEQFCCLRVISFSTLNRTKNRW